MKKITTIVLASITALGTYLVGEGLITGEQLSDIQSVIGLALAGGGLSIGLIIAIISAIPKQLVTAGYDKAVETYGQVAVDNFINKIDDVMAVMQSVDSKLDTVKADLDADRELRTEILNG